MKKTRSLSKKMNSLWTSLASGMKNKGNKREQNKEIGDMVDTCTPVSGLDLSGMNREQAKVAIDKMITEKLEKVSMIEFSELDTDRIKKETRMTSTDKRIFEKRNKKKQRKSEEAQLIITDEGSFADFKPASIFNAIQPEELPLKEEVLELHEIHEEPIEGQLSILEDIEVMEFSEETSTDFLSSKKPINTSFDSSIDKIFEFCGSSMAKLVGKCNNTSRLLIKRLATPVKRIEEKLELKKKLDSVSAAFIKIDERSSDKMYLFIEFIDRNNEAAIRGINRIGKNIYRSLIHVRKFSENHRKKLLVSFGAGVVVCAAITVTIGSMTAYEYIYNGKVLGIAKNQEDVYKTIEVIGDKLSYQYDAEIYIDKEKDIRFNKVIAFNQDIDNKEEILNRLTYMRDMKANGYGIYIDGKLAVVLESEKTARSVLQQVKSNYAINDNGVEFKEIGFAENVTIADIETKLGSIKKKDQAFDYLMTGAIEKKIHVVQQGETFSEIASIYNIKQSELQSANPDVTPEKLQIGQEIGLNRIVPLVTVKTVEVAQYKETIPYEIKYEDTNTLYKNEQTVKLAGSNGEKDVVAEIVRHNGVEVDRKEIKSTILTEPSPQVVMVGTKELPPLIGTGNLTYPIRGKLTSRYGQRWGRMHKGIDLAAPTGTKIKASDGGKVIFSGYNGALGYTVKIDHGGGKVTLYGHCSKLHVKAGDRVYQGQHIANVGSTGRSTGPHVHFEVHVNGVAKNPLNYL